MTSCILTYMCFAIKSFFEGYFEAYFYGLILAHFSNKYYDPCN